ncbi:FadR/GntR family transcriptional regulator [Gimesia panareensis]|uniref:FadR/GntR family transcriptional regulator n=1 Tax=Gimesia panareensis TaxID=2527978 RepID=UPI00118AD30D|nr:FCD domain-containing protein [Gimesia panareensis]QDU51965.1 HTH-type transcriptional regulator LutR [Gimesia panareensis]
MKTDSQQNTMSTQLAEKIRSRIVQEQLPAGHVFMTEGQLAEEYQVSRTIVREAVSRLRALGILDGKQRKGLVVRRPDLVQLLSESLPLLTVSQNDRDELKLLRYVLEIGAIELAVRNATSAQLDQLDSLVEEMQSCAERQEWDRSVELDLAFHTLVLEMTDSRYVAGMQQILAEYFHSLPEVGTLDSAQTARIVWEHAELASAIRRQDLEHARVLIRQQFQDLI